MWISRVTIENIKAFEGITEITLDRKMNILIGENNAGKSVIIKAINLLQNSGCMSLMDIRYGKQNGKVVVKLEEINEDFRDIFRRDNISEAHYDLNKDLNSASLSTFNSSGQKVSLGPIPNREPNNFIYPFFSKRKVGGFQEMVNLDNTQVVREDLHFLIPKIDRLSDRNHPAHEEYREACTKIIGFPISTQASPNGKRAGIWLDEFKNIPIEAMGDGIPHLLGLITDLCIANGKLFLIEELENDIHPKALKNLLNLIVSKAALNQFVISTHSNIVAKYLGSIEDAKLHHISRNLETRIPTAIYREVGNSPEERRAVLEELGYEMTDYDMWKGWLILEESSAERIINDFLIPAFAPSLKGKLRTISANSISRVEPKFEDFNRLFLFTHLGQSYKNRAWVAVDDGEDGEATIKSLKDKYLTSGWKEENFIKLTRKDFEEYYPEEFKEKAAVALRLLDKQKKREAKKRLLDEVLAWIEANREEAIKKFESSATEIICVLRLIENELC